MTGAVLVALAGLAVVALSSGRRRGAAPSRRYSRADVEAAIDLAVRAHPILPAWFVWAMADKESSLKPGARHVDLAERSFGLFQVNWNAHGAELTRRGIAQGQLYDPMVNAAYWSELADDLTRAARARGIEGDHVWYAVRLRLKGIAWDDFGGDLARTAILAFRPYVARWKARMGA